MSVQSEQPFTPHNESHADGAAPPRSEQPAPAAGPTEAHDELETVRNELAEIEQKADEYLRLAQRTQADFINFRRRVEEERQTQAREAGLTVLQKLLPILDDFERALANAAPADLESSWGQGVQLVQRNLRSLLSSEGVESIDTEGAVFDPRLHEAVGSAPSADVPEGHVLHIARNGYRKGERVLRPTQVIVARRPD